MSARALVTAILLALAMLVVPPRPGCDPIDSAACLLPFPNDWFTVADRSTATGRRIALTGEMTPRNRAGVPIDPAEWNRGDGFSPGSTLLAHVPNVDLGRTGAAPVTDIGRSLRRDAPIVLLDTVTGERWPYWAELDANASSPDRTALIVRPARNLTEGHRYAVALRGMRDATCATMAPPAAFGAIRGPRLSAARGYPRPAAARGRSAVRAAAAGSPDVRRPRQARCRHR